VRTDTASSANSTIRARASAWRHGYCAGKQPRDAARPPEVAPKPLRAFHPDQLAAAERLQDVFTSALGADVRVVPRKQGYTVTLAVESLGEAEALAERLSFRAAAGD